MSSPWVGLCVRPALFPCTDPLPLLHPNLWFPRRVSHIKSLSGPVRGYFRPQNLIKRLDRTERSLLRVQVREDCSACTPATPVCPSIFGPGSISPSQDAVRSWEHPDFSGTMLTLLTSMYVVVRAVSTQVSWKQHRRLLDRRSWPRVLERTMTDLLCSFLCSGEQLYTNTASPVF